GCQAFSGQMTPSRVPWGTSRVREIFIIHDVKNSGVTSDTKKLRGSEAVALVLRRCAREPLRKGNAK
ncbi:MAG TPA: hypothetical protein VGU64_16635, partial [Terriglobales bacterium]|nr:hypothetical protein [Terriglobales bacterium]